MGQPSRSCTLRTAQECASIRRVGRADGMIPAVRRSMSPHETAPHLTSLLPNEHEWSEHRVYVDGVLYRCRCRTVGRLLEITSGDLRVIEPRGILRLEVALKSSVARALRKQKRVTSVAARAA